MPTSIVPTYGADSVGLICGFHFDANGRGRPVSSDQALLWLSEPLAQEGFVWLHFNLAYAATEKWLRENITPIGAFHEALRDGSRSPRVELDDDSLVAVVNDVHYNFAFDPSDIGTLWLLVRARVVVSARMQPLRSIDRLREAVNQGTALRSSVELLVHLMHAQGDVLENIVRSTTERVDSIEDKLLAGRMENRRSDLGSLRRLLVRLQRLLAPEPAALFRLLQKPPRWIGQEDLQDLHQSTEDFNVALTDMAALQERIKLLQEEIEGRVAEQNNRSLFVLTVVTVLALPINIIAGLLGMNVGGVPLAQHENGFWIVVAIVGFIAAAAGWIAFRRTRD